MAWRSFPGLGGLGALVVELALVVRAPGFQHAPGTDLDDLRHRFAVDYPRAGGSIYDLQQILGHTSIKTTEVYLAYLTPEEAAAAKRGTAQILAQPAHAGQAAPRLDFRRKTGNGHATIMAQIPAQLRRSARGCSPRQTRKTKHSEEIGGQRGIRTLGTA